MLSLPQFPATDNRGALPSHEEQDALSNVHGDEMGWLLPGRNCDEANMGQLVTLVETEGVMPEAKPAGTASVAGEIGE